MSRVFRQAAGANLGIDASDAVVVEELSGSNLVEAPEPSLVVLTLASYAFRLVTLFHVDENGPAGDYFLAGNVSGNFFEIFGEMANRCCGAMNRALGEHFPHMGMSTPFRLDSASLPYLDVLKPSVVSRYRICIAGTVSLHASLCFCAYVPLDFEAAAAAAEEATGMLELF